MAFMVHECLSLSFRTCAFESKQFSYPEATILKRPYWNYIRERYLKRNSSRLQLFELSNYQHTNINRWVNKSLDDSNPLHEVRLLNFCKTSDILLSSTSFSPTQSIDHHSKCFPIIRKHRLYLWQLLSFHYTPSQWYSKTKFAH